MPWLSAYSVVLVVALIAVGVLTGRIRGDAPSAIALYTIGLVILFFGLAWSTTFGQAAFGATVVACLGAVFLAIGWERSRSGRGP